jgi:integrase
VPRFAAIPEAERPSFHEVRGLGARLQKLRGRSLREVQELMTHSDPKTTQIYLELGRAALTDEHFTQVSVPFTLKELLG